MSEKILIKGLDKAEVLVALYVAAKIVKRKHHQPVRWQDMDLTISAAQELIAGSKSKQFSWFNGRHLQISLEGDHLDPTEYDKFNGAGLASATISLLRRRIGENNVVLQKIEI